MLTEEAAREIFSRRPQYALDKSGQYTFQSQSSESPTIIGSKYKVSSRTVRDIWNRKAWARITRPDWTPGEVAASEESTNAKDAAVIPVQIRKRGRPCGSKDAFPRTKRRETETPSNSSLCGDRLARADDLADKDQAAILDLNDSSSLQAFCERPSICHQHVPITSDPDGTLTNNGTVMLQPAAMRNPKNEAPALTALGSESQPSPSLLVKEWLDHASKILSSRSAAVPTLNALSLGSRNADRRSSCSQPLVRQSEPTLPESGPLALWPPVAQPSGSHAPLSAALSLLAPQPLPTHQPPLFPPRPPLFPPRALSPQLQAPPESTRTCPPAGPQPTPSLSPLLSSSLFASVLRSSASSSSVHASCSSSPPSVACSTFRRGPVPDRAGMPDADMSVAPHRSFFARPTLGGC